MAKESVCRIICTGTPEDGDMARAFPPLPFQKRATGAEVPFHHRRRSRQIFGVRRMLPEFPQTCPKSFLWNFCIQIFSHKHHEDLFLVQPPRKGLHVCLCKPWAPFFEVKQRWALFLPGFSGLLPRLSANQNFWDWLATSAPPPPTPLLFITVSQVISWFIKIDLKQIYCSNFDTQKIQNDFLSFLLLFLRSTLLMNRNKHNWKRFFYKFPLLSTVLLLPLPYRTVARKFSAEGLFVCSGGLTFWNLIKTPPIYSAS